jgi:predicted flap endonuclease-1-like 5' DNA nuclease
MTIHRDYKEEAAVARQAARLKLAEFRAERQKRRNRTVAKPPQSNSGALSSSSQIDPTDFFDQASDQSSDSEPQAPHALDKDAAVTGLIPSEADSPTDDFSEAQTADAEGKNPISIDAIPDVRPSAEPSLHATPPTLAESDLFDLPAIGPGMVWMLHQCGIGSLQQLSVAKADELAARLGVVGQIVSMEPWIAYARDRQTDSL